MRLLPASILENKKVGNPDFYRLMLHTEKPLPALPGQFLQIPVNDTSSDPLLRRPFSIAGITETKITLLYRIKGKGTALLSRRKTGEIISLLGPLGGCYPILPQPKIILAGGLGAASLLFLVSHLARQKNPYPVTIILGAKTEEHLFYLSDFQKSGFPVLYATEDGSAGFKGLATFLLSEKIPSLDRKNILYACGPNPMLREVSRLAKRSGWQTYLSLETAMACGYGVCRGCAVLTREGYRLVCTDGPVFASEQIIWEEFPE
ncbi:MAG: dihydroorotate dehydrogenase electron transfer subunit [Candidatus Omnitrophota bacterium]